MTKATSKNQNAHKYDQDQTIRSLVLVRVANNIVRT